MSQIANGALVEALNGALVEALNGALVNGYVSSRQRFNGALASSKQRLNGALVKGHAGCRLNGVIGIPALFCMV